ncbi:MAG TPA: hypothetical protein VK936_07935 [Longimicrobiales bacterium]|nr:hypothetical protein [Longimicrobiales bacterium]
MLGYRSVLIAAALAVVLPPAAGAQVIPGSDYDYYDDYELAVGEYYGSPHDRIPRWIDPDELPVIYLLAREARVSPEIIIALRERGWSWIDITYHLGVDPYVYVARMPYTTGYWRRYSAWELRYLSDRHIIDFVSAMFWADYHRRPLRQVIVIRDRVPAWRYYVRYHSPPRTVARGVVRSPSPPSRNDPRRAVPRDVRGSDQGRDRPTAQPRNTRDGPAQGVTRQPSGRPSGNEASAGSTRRATEERARTEDRARTEQRARTEDRSRTPARPRAEDRSRTEQRPAARGVNGASRQEAAPTRREAAPTRREAAPSRNDGATRSSSGSSRGAPAAGARSASPRSSPPSGQSGRSGGRGG